jgi:hypothetical protein
MEAFRETALLLWSAPIIVALILAEVLWTHFHEVRAYTLKETLTNCYMAAMNGTYDVLMRGVVLVAMTLFFQHKLLDLERGPFNIVLHEWRDVIRDVRTQARTWGERLSFVLRGPGWRPKP